MKSLKFSFILLILLASCRPIPEARVTVTSPAKSTSTSMTPVEPSATSISDAPTAETSPTPESSPTAEVISGMTERYYNLFNDEKQLDTRLINGVETPVIIGTRYDKSEHVIAMEIEGKMVAVSEYIDDAGYSYYVYISPENSVDGRFTVYEQTAQLFFDSTKNPSIWRSIGDQMGLTPKGARNRVMKENGGIVTIRVPVRDESAGGNYPFRYEQITVNFNLPIEAWLQATAEGFNSLPSDIKTKMVTDRGFWDKGGEFDDKTGDLLTEDIPFSSALVWSNPDKSLLIVSTSTLVEGRPALLDPALEKNTDIGKLQNKLRDLLQSPIMRIIHFVGTRDISFSAVGNYANNPFDFFRVTNLPP